MLYIIIIITCERVSRRTMAYVYFSISTTSEDSSGCSIQDLLEQRETTEQKN